VADYEGDDLLRLATERLLITIGEALRRAAEVDPDLMDQIGRSDQIIAFRNQLVHNYPSIDSGKVWRIIEHDLPILLAEVRTILLAPA
jgi:uncharacterized protein with HEPN domain